VGSGWVYIESSSPNISSACSPAPVDLIGPAGIFQISQRCSQSHPYPPLSSKLMEVKTQLGTWEVGRVPWEARGLLTVFEVESVEIQAFDEVTQSLRLEGSHPRVAHLPGEVGRGEKRETLSHCFWHKSLQNPNGSCWG